MNDFFPSGFLYIPECLTRRKPILWDLQNMLHHKVSIGNWEYERHQRISVCLWDVLLLQTAKTQGKEGQGIRRLSGAVGRVDDVKYISPSYPLLLNLYLVILEKTWENVLMVRKDKLQQEKCMSGNSAQTLQCLCFHEVLLNTSRKIIGSFA